jgi:CRP-like cAMP-binding protein
MFTAESELFKDVGEGALEIIKGRGAEKTYAKGDFVFREGDGAESFYVLVEGAVHLVMGDEEELCFVVDGSGELFGWSALVESYRYRASACCTAGARLIEIPRSAVEQVTKDYPEDGIAIFRNLTRIVTERLCEAYRQPISDADLEGMGSAADQEL